MNSTHGAVEGAWPSETGALMVSLASGYAAIAPAFRAGT
jgi:hypothetical protein